MSAGRSLIALLVGTVAFFAVWYVALKPSASTTTGGQPTGLGQYQSDLNAAHGAVAEAEGAAARDGGDAAPGATAPGSATTTPARAATTPTPAPVAHHAAVRAVAATHPAVHAATTPKAVVGPARPVSHAPATPTQRLDVVSRALAAHKVVAMLFYNPAAAEDQAVKQELGTIPTHHGSVVKLEVPLNELGNYPVVIDQVLVSSSPTLVVIDKHSAATTIVGYTTAFEIGQRVDDALGA